MDSEQTARIKKGSMVFHTAHKLKGIVVNITPICVAVEWTNGHKSYMHPHDMNDIKMHSISTEMLAVTQ